MVFTSIEFDNKGEKFQSCYKYEIGKFTISEYLRALSSSLMCFDSRTLDNIYHSLDKELFVLYGIMIEVCSDPYDRPVTLAISDSIDELSILADLHGLTPIVNEVWAF